MIRVGFILNGAIKLGKQAKLTLALAQQSEYLITEIVETKYAKHAIEIAKEWAKSKQILVAVGGDGTCNEVLNGWHQAQEIHCALGIVPDGTGNDFHKMVGVFDPEEFVASLEAMHVQQVDYGILHSEAGEKAFLNISDLGFGAAVVARMEAQRRLGIGGKVSYALAILRAFLVYRKQEVELEFDGILWKGKTLLVAFCNGSTFGHGLTIYPGASILDQTLGVTIVGDVSVFTYARKLGQLKKGIKIKHPGLQYKQVREIGFVRVPSKIRIETDGELLKSLPEKITLIGEALPLIF